MAMILHNPLFAEAQEREEEEVRLLVRGCDSPSRNSRNSDFGGHHTYLPGTLDGPFGPGFRRRIRLFKAASSRERKSSLPNGLPVSSCRRSASDSWSECPTDRKVTQSATNLRRGVTFANAFWTFGDNNTDPGPSTVSPEFSRRYSGIPGIHQFTGIQYPPLIESEWIDNSFGFGPARVFFMLTSYRKHCTKKRPPLSSRRESSSKGNCREYT